MLKSVFKWFWAAVLVLLAVPIVGGMGGCVDDWVKTDVPRETQKALGVPARVPLSQARTLAEEWRDLQEAEAKRLAAEEKAQREAAAAEAARIRAEVEDQLAAAEADAARVTREGTRKLAAFEAAELSRSAGADAALARWAETAGASSKRFASSIAAAESQAAAFGGVLGDVGGLVQGAANSSGVPGLGLVVAGALGLLIRKPGDGKKIAEAEIEKKATQAAADAMAAQLAAMQDRLDEMTAKADRDFDDGFNKGRQPFIKEVFTVPPSAGTAVVAA